MGPVVEREDDAPRARRAAQDRVGIHPPREDEDAAEEQERIGHQRPDGQTEGRWPHRDRVRRQREQRAGRRVHRETDGRHLVW